MIQARFKRKSASDAALVASDKRFSRWRSNCRDRQLSTALDRPFSRHRSATVSWIDGTSRRWSQAAAEPHPESEPTQPQKTSFSGPRDALGCSASGSQDRGRSAVVSSRGVAVGCAGHRADHVAVWTESRCPTGALRPRRVRLGGIGKGVRDAQSQNLSSISATSRSR